MSRKSKSYEGDRYKGVSLIYIVSENLIKYVQNVESRDYK